MISENSKKICIGFLSVCFVYASSQPIMFQRTYGGTGNDHGRSVQQTFDGGYIVAGATSSFGNGTMDVYLFKTDSLGNLQWQKTFGGPNVEWGYSVQQTSDSGFVIAGFTNSFGNGGYDAYLIRTKPNGDTLWTKTYGGSNWDFAYSVKPTADGGFILAGGTYSFGYGNEDMYLIKTNSSGDTLWTKNFGGTKEDEARSVWVNTDGSYALAGHTESFGAGNSDAYYLIVGQNGNLIWTKTVGGTGEEKFFSIRQTSSGDFIAIGYSNSFGGGNNDFYLVKMNTAGDTNWTYRSGSADDKIAYSVTQKSNDGGYFFVGNTSYLGSEIFFWRTNSGPPPWMWVWNGTMGDGTIIPDVAYHVEETSDGGFIIIGETESFGFGLNDAYLIKTNDSGLTNLYNSVPVNFTDAAWLKIYPTPFSSSATVHLPKDFFIKHNMLLLSFYDFTGRHITSYPISSDVTIIKKGNLSSGIYLFRLESISEKVIFYNGKILID